MRIHLTRHEREFYHRLNRYGGECIEDYPVHEVAHVVRSLEQKGLVRGAYTEGGGVEGVRLTAAGRSYIRGNPRLLNPVSWQMVAAAAALAMLVATIAIAIAGCAALLR